MVVEFICDMCVLQCVAVCCSVLQSLYVVCDMEYVVEFNVS